MTFPTVPVTVALSQLLGAAPDGTIVTGTLDKDDRYGGFIVQSSVSGVTVAGSVVLNCFPNNPTTGLGITGSVYVFTANIAGALWRATAQIPNVACNLHDIAVLPTVPATGNPAWGNISGVLANQADLQAALNARLPGGSTTQVQYNNAGAFAGNAGFTYVSATNTLTVANLTGVASAATLATAATALATPRAINGVNFDGSAAITVPAAAGTLTGAALAAGVTGSSLTSVGTSLSLGGNVGLFANSGNIIEQYSGASAQSHRWFNTRTDINNGEWVEGQWAGNTWSLQAKANGAGTIRGIAFKGGASSNATLSLDDSVGARLAWTATSGVSMDGNGTKFFGSTRWPTVTKTANFTSTVAEETILVDATAGNVVITLEAVGAGNVGRIKLIKKIDSSANTVTIDGNASETIDGSLTIVLSTQWAARGIQVNAGGTAWNVIATV